MDLHKALNGLGASHAQEIHMDFWRKIGPPSKRSCAELTRREN
jgi:hypothetical protein